MPIYSHSRLTTFEQCPLKYKYQYIEGITTEVENIEAFMGNIVHRCLQKLYADLLHSRLDSLPELLARYHRQWEQSWHDKIRIVKQEYSAENYRQTGEKCIKNYYKQYAPFDGEKTLALELKVATDLGDYRSYKFIGFIDRLAQSADGTFEIRDYKTSGTLPTQSQIDADRQLALYQLAADKDWNFNERVKLIWHYLLFNKELHSKRSPEELQQLQQETIEQIQRIESCRLFPPQESSLCNWCEYISLCPRMKHLARVIPLEENEYLKDDGVLLVEKYARLKEEIAVMEKELEKLREAIISYARKEKMEVMVGQKNRLLIKMEEKLKLPDKSDQTRRQPLEELLQRSGKWLEVSRLDGSALSKALLQGGWNPELVEKIKQYINIEKKYSVRLSSLNRQGQLHLFSEE